MASPQRIELPRGSGAIPVETRQVAFKDGIRDVPVYDRSQLGAGDHFEGPAIVTQLDATTLVAPGWQGEVHSSGAMLLTQLGAE
jgi:N-methylhydantoinase A